jgi:hypothetical protein
MFSEKGKIEFGVFGKRLVNVRIEIQGDQSATVVGAEWYLAARIG